MTAKKNKLFIFTSLATLAVSAAAIMVTSFNFGAAYRAKASTGVSSSIVFSRDSGTFTKIDDNTASISGTSYYGSTYYAVSHNNGDISGTNYVAQFAYGKAADAMYISFSTTATGTDDEAFESITGIKITTTTSTDYSFYVFYGDTFSSSVAVKGSSNPSKVIFDNPLTKLRVGLGTVPVTAKYITSIELFYDCGVEPEPVTPDHVAVYNAKNYYEVGDSFVKPEVKMIFSDTTTEVIDPDNVTCSGYNMSTAGEQTVSVSAEYKGTVYNTSYKITVTDPYSTTYSISYEMFSWSDFDYLDINDYLQLDACIMPSLFNEGEDVIIKIVFSNTEYEMWGLSIVESEDWSSYSTADGETFVCAFPSMDVTLTLNVGKA